MSFSSSDMHDIKPTAKIEADAINHETKEYFLLIEAIADIPNARTNRELSFINQVKRINNQIATRVEEGHFTTQINVSTVEAAELIKTLKAKGYIISNISSESDRYCERRNIITLSWS
jgi:pyridoxine 5'-phosphate synthase PdxJ